MRPFAQLNMLAALLPAVLIFGCAPETSNLPVKDAVLSPGEAVEARNRAGEIAVEYVSPTQRRYRLDRVSHVVRLIPRDQPFRGVSGLYNPAETWFGLPPGVRFVVQESRINFRTNEEIYAFLRQSDAVMDWVYTSDGLVVGFSREPDRNQVSVDLWQLLVNGEKPENLSGSQDEMIRRVVVAKP